MNVKPSYSYDDWPLVPQWRQTHGLPLGLFVMACCLAALVTQRESASLDVLALQVVFPALLAFVLAFAPRPRERTSALIKDLFVVATALACFAGDLQPLLMVLAPFLLGLGVALGAFAGRRRLAS